MSTYRHPTPWGSEKKRQRRATTGRIVVLVTSLLASMVVVTMSSRGFFMDATESADNSWNAGTVIITDDADRNSPTDASGEAMFSAENMGPGSQQEACIVVTYEGSLAADVRLYAEEVTGDLGPYLTLTIQYGSGGEFNDCTGFTSGGTLFTGSLALFATEHPDYLLGVDDWTPDAEESRTYRFHIVLQDNDLAQGKGASATFVWEARSIDE